MLNKKTLLFGILFWVILFAEISIIGFTPQFASIGSNGFELNLYGQIIHFIILLIVSFYFAKTFFSGKTVAFTDGLKLGITILIIGTILDLIVTVPLFVKSYQLFYSDPFLWLGFLIVLLGFGFGAALKKR